jgi:hypothetical protein
VALFDPAGKPFGWAHHAERDHIRAHLARRRGPVEPHSWDFYHREQRVNAIQWRIHKYDKSFAQRSREWREAQELRAALERTGDDLALTWEELDRVAEHFAGANDPVAIAIGKKALAALARRPERP